MEYEEIVLQTIVSGGNARSFSMEAIMQAKKGDIASARENLKKASEELLKAHKIQTQLIQNEAAGNQSKVTLLMVHAQDHLMNAITVRDLAKEFVDMYENMDNIKK